MCATSTAGICRCVGACPAIALLSSRGLDRGIDNDISDQGPAVRLCCAFVLVHQSDWVEDHSLC